MLIVPIEDARPGMVLAAPVGNPEHAQQDLLKRNYVLEESVIQRLGALGVEFIYVDYPALSDLDRQLAAQLSPERQTVYRQIRQAITASEHHTRPTVNYQDYYTGTRDLIVTLLSQGHHPIYMDQMSRLGDNAIAHATAVAHLSLLLGLKLETYLIDQRRRLTPQHAREVVNLGVAGMLHDMGKLQLPEELRRHHGLDMPADPQQLAQWQEHARLGYELIHNQVEASAASAVLHHHQHFDGSGFPARVHHDGTRTQMSGQRIHVFARILHLADLYDRLSTGRRGRKRRSTLQVLHQLHTRYAGWVDPVILKVLEAVCPAFPPGSRVGLSNGASAIVTALNAGKPFTPVVRRLDADGWTLQEQPLDLSADGAPSIVTLNGHPVAQLVIEMTAPNRNGAAAAITNPATGASAPPAAGD